MRPLFARPTAMPRSLPVPPPSSAPPRASPPTRTARVRLTPAQCARLAAQIGRQRHPDQMRTLLLRTLTAKTCGIADIVPLAEAIHAHQRAALAAQVAAHPSAHHETLPAQEAWVDTLIAQTIVTTAAFYLRVDVHTWYAWMTAHPAWAKDSTALADAWVHVWTRLPPAAWTRGRILQVAEVLSPQAPAALVAQFAPRWADGNGALADDLTAALPAAGMRFLRTRLAFDAVGTPMQVLAADVTPLVDPTEILRLSHVVWADRTSAERCGLLRRCVYDAIPEALTDPLTTLASGLLKAERPLAVLAAHRLIFAQRSSRTLTHACRLVRRLAPPGATRADRAILCHLTAWVTTATDLDQAPHLVTMVCDAWPSLRPVEWMPAMTALVRQGLSPSEVRETLQVWWQSQDDTPPAVSPGLVEACLSSPDRALAVWAIATLVPHVAAPRAARRPAPLEASATPVLPDGPEPPEGPAGPTTPPPAGPAAPSTVRVVRPRR